MKKTAAARRRCVLPATVGSIRFVQSSDQFISRVFALPLAGSLVVSGGGQVCLMGRVAPLTTRGSPDSHAVDGLEIELVCGRDFEGVVPGIDVANRVASEFAR